VATLQELLDEQARVKAELQRMEEDQSVTEEDSADLRDTLIERYEDLDKKIKPVVERLEKVRGITRAAGQAGGSEPGADTGYQAQRGTPEFMQRHDPFDNLDAVRGNMVRSGDLIARAMNSIEDYNKRHLLADERAETAVGRIRERPDIARHALLTGSDDYLEAFRSYLNDPTGEGKRIAERSLGIASGGVGGYLLPYILDPTIVLTNSGAANPYRRLSRVVQTTSNAWQGVNSAGVVSAWVNEGVASTDGFTNGVGQIQIYVKKAAAWVFGSYEAIGGPNAAGDTNFADQLPPLFADERDILEEAAFAIGTGGSANQGTPLGVLPAIAGTGSRVAAASGGAAFSGTGSQPAQDIYSLQSGLGPRFRKKPSVGWLADISTINKARSLDVYGGSSFWANFGDDTPEQLLGKPIAESSSIPGTGAGTGTGTGAAVLVYGSWEDFIIVDRVGASMIYEPMVKSSGNATMPSGDAGWYYFWRVGSGVTTANAFKYLTNG
jgi:HK97 family phage major capsid protein